jgi:hypothetical protein
MNNNYIGGGQGDQSILSTKTTNSLKNNQQVQKNVEDFYKARD